MRGRLGSHLCNARKEPVLVQSPARPNCYIYAPGGHLSYIEPQHPFGKEDKYPAVKPTRDAQFV